MTTTVARQFAERNQLLSLTKFQPGGYEDDGRQPTLLINDPTGFPGAADCQVANIKLYYFLFTCTPYLLGCDLIQEIFFVWADDMFISCSQGHYSRGTCA